MKSLAVRAAGCVVLAATWFPLASAQAKSQEVRLEEKSPSARKESLIWNVGREITGFKVDIRDGNPIINTIKFLPGQEFTVGAQFSKGQSWERKLDTPTQVNQLRVNVDKAEGSRVRLTLYTGGSGGSKAGAVSSESGSVKRPGSKKESLIWDVNQDLRGFEIFVREGRPIINTIKIMGGEEFAVGAYIDAGRSWRKDFSGKVRVGQIRVNVDQAVGSALELKLYR